MRILFDLDGTIIDPQIGITRSLQYALKKSGKPVPPAKDLLWCIGPPLHESIRTLLEADNDADMWEGVRLYRERYSATGVLENTLYSGIVDSFKALANAGHTLSIATSKPEIYAKQIITHFALDDFFTAIDGSELDGTRSDKTDLLAHIIQRDSLDPKGTLMIGDRKHDIIGAKNNSVLFIGALWGYGTLVELETNGACMCIHSPIDLAQAIQDISVDLSQ